MKRLVLLVEGEYDGDPVCNLVSRVIAQRCPEAFGSVFIDSHALRVGNIPKLSGRNGGRSWLRHLQVAGRRADVGGVIAVIDSDEDEFEGHPFCAANTARTLAERAAQAGAGITFSLAVVLLRQEFESLLIAAAEQLPGFNGAAIPGSVEVAPRDAKGWLGENLSEGYKPQADQLRLTQAVVDWDPIRLRMRSFRRFENAVLELVQAVQAGRAIATPSLLPPPPAPNP